MTEEGIKVLGQAIEQVFIQLLVLNSVTFIAGVVFGFFAGRKQ